MERDLLIRLSGYASIAAPLFALAALVGFIAVVGSDDISDAARSASFYFPAVMALASIACLAVALVGLFLRQEQQLGSLGVAGFLVALVGTLVAAGGLWTYVFVVPHFAAAVPEMINESTGSVLVGFFGSFALMAVGWLLFGLATLRAKVFPRWAALLLVAGAAITILPLPSRTLVLALAVGVVGYRLTGDAPRARSGSETMAGRQRIAETEA